MFDIPTIEQLIQSCPLLDLIQDSSFLVETTGPSGETFVVKFKVEAGYDPVVYPQMIRQSGIFTGTDDVTLDAMSRILNAKIKILLLGLIALGSTCKEFLGGLKHKTLSISNSLEYLETIHLAIQDMSMETKMAERWENFLGAAQRFIDAME